MIQIIDGNLLDTPLHYIGHQDTGIPRFPVVIKIHPVGGKD